MSKQRKVHRRKRKTGYITLVKPKKFRKEFNSFVSLANYFGVK